MPLFQDISTPGFDRIREVLHRLAANPPQVLLLEGGTEPQRLAAARYWAACQLPAAGRRGRALPHLPHLHADRCR